jgi:uroporphyrin-III C-methyltransferase/precorrin-2 dehydrogenase/sirohydrochlorin ferrochelatase
MLKFNSFPLSYDVADKPVLVIGEGAQALQKLRLLARTTARLFLFAERPDDDLAQFAAAEGVSLVRRAPNDAEMAEASLIFVATGAIESDRTLAARARDAGTPVNVVDRPALSDFATPAIVDRAPIAIAISTDGHAPVLALKLRGAIEAMLSPHFGRLGALAAEVRGRALAIGRLPDAAARRGFWSRLFDGPAAAAALEGDHDRAVALALAELDAAPAAASRGKLFLIGAGPGDEDLITLRAHRLLLSADVVAHDADVPAAIVNLSRRDSDRLLMTGSRAQREETLAALVRQGKRVAWLSRGGALTEPTPSLRAAGVEIEIIPGLGAPPAPTAAPLREAA